MFNLNLRKLIDNWMRVCSHETIESRNESSCCKRIRKHLEEFTPALLSNGWDTQEDGSDETNEEIISRSLRDLLVNGSYAGAEVVIAYVTMNPTVSIKINHRSGNVFEYPGEEDPTRIIKMQLYFDPLIKHYDVLAPSSAYTSEQLTTISVDCARRTSVP